MSSIVRPACFSTALTAGIGERPIISGRIAATAAATARARGLIPRSRALPSDLTSTAAARRALNSRRDELVALVRLDRVKGHPDRLQRGCAEAVDGDPGDVMVDPGQQRRIARHVVALLMVREATTHHDVIGLAEIDLR